jgi:KaiC/GvpD/RAD55 family RecA-like ATPase
LTQKCRFWIGSGKTTIATQFLLAAAEAGGRSLYITLYEVADDGSRAACTGGFAERGMEEQAQLIEAAEKWVSLRSGRRRIRTGGAAKARQTVPTRPIFVRIFKSSE